MKILAIGDIFGKPGRRIIKKYLPELKERHQIDFVVANVENATHGKGISEKHYDKLKFADTEKKKILIDVMTSGNHIFAIEKTKEHINKVSDLLRPLNFNPYHPGPGTILVKVKGKKIRVTNLIGNNFMPNAPQNPYFALEKVLNLQD
jgi:2',3'-cyclic-nucleotide 2'-phosphodiesterase